MQITNLLNNYYIFSIVEKLTSKFIGFLSLKIKKLKAIAYTKIRLIVDIK